MPIREAYVTLLPVGFQMVFHSSEVLFSMCRYRGSLTFPLKKFLLVYFGCKAVCNIFSYQNYLPQVHGRVLNLGTTE